MTAHKLGFAVAAFNSIPATRKEHEKFEMQGCNDFALRGDTAENPHMGPQGDAWSRGYWGAVVAVLRQNSN